MPRQRLVVLYGGTSSEHEISVRSATSVLQALDRDRFDPVPVRIGRDRSWRHAGPGESTEGATAVPDLRALGPDVVFPLLHGTNGEDGTIQGMLEILGLPYVGSGVLASSVCMDKAVQKHVVARVAPQIPLVPFVEADLRAEDLRPALSQAEELGFPLFCKPANLGSSVGVAKCETPQELHDALSIAMGYDHKALIEKGVDAREIEVAVLGNGAADTLVSAPGEIGLPPGVWYDYETKYLKDVATYHIPADMPGTTAAQIREHALQAFRATECSGLARVDFLVDRATGTAYLNELNTMPGFTSISMYPKLIEHEGISYRDLITRLCELALARHAARSSLSLER